MMAAKARATVRTARGDEDSARLAGEGHERRMRTTTAKSDGPKIG
jgi:hypothetical protein